MRDNRPSKAHVSLEARLRAQDDAEVAAFERKLRLKPGRALPKSFQDDGLDDLLGDLEVAEHGSTKRKAEDSRWLADKRRKLRDLEEEDVSDLEAAFEGFDDDGLHDVGSESEGRVASDKEDEEEEKEDTSDMTRLGSGSEDEKSERLSRVREDPYKPPTTEAAGGGKYVPPALRNQNQDAGSGKEDEIRVRKELQGTINRVTLDNMLSIVGEVEVRYRRYPRQIMSSTVVDLLLVQASNSKTLSDTLLMDLASFGAALYRVLGTDFGALLIERLATAFHEYYAQASGFKSETSALPKQTSNLITILSELYALEVVRSKIMFDYVRLLLQELTELNAELLLRIVRMCGQLLRHDDPLALKDLISVIRQAVAKAGGEDKLSQRTKTIIQTINDLKNNRAKATSIVVVEHRKRARKLLSTLGTRKSGATEPLGVGIEDILNSNRKGKWWLVGASWAGHAQDETVGDAQDAEEGSSHDADDDIIPDIAGLARQNGMNTDVRRAIFVALILSTDCDDGYARIMGIKLNKHQQREIPAVVMRCAGAEPAYNHYYTLVAERLCSSHKMRWGFQDQAWKLFKRLGESLFGGVPEDDEDITPEDEEIDDSRAVNVGKMLGSLVASGVQSLALLKCLNLPAVQPKTKFLVENLLVTALLQVQREGKVAGIRKLFESLDQPGLLQGVQWFLVKVVRKSRLPDKGDKSALRTACKEADSALKEILLRVEGERS
jgi:nucleolar MIF4G domain-containing protein 1